jgi:hypothetical protein
MTELFIHPLDVIQRVKQRFLELTGIEDLEVQEEQVGPELFLCFTVGQDAPMYRRALGVISRELGPESEFRGRLTLKIRGDKYTLKSEETQLLNSLIAKSLRVTSDVATGDVAVEFVPFKGGEEQTISEPANHVILGRRGVGKSSLILLAVGKVSSAGNVPVWVDLQPYNRRSEADCVAQVLRETLHLAGRRFRGADSSFQRLLEPAAEPLTRLIERGSSTEQDIRSAVPAVRGRVRDFTQQSGKQVYVFLDDAHMISPELQPLLFDAFHSVLKGAGGWLNVAGVKNLTRLYDSSRAVGLQMPHDAQPVNLDLTLTDPGAARDHLVAILEKFLSMCGIKRRLSIIPDRAINRLVWCSAGVPRDFLWLFQRAMQHALQNRRSRIGVQEVNLAVGEFGQLKMDDLASDATENSELLEAFLQRVQEKCLTEARTNSFLARRTPRKRGYELLQKLVDLRLVHLLHPSITPGKAGERYEAYLLDYSFYTGIRRRHGLSELTISSDSPPKYAELRSLPKIDIEALSD